MKRKRMKRIKKKESKYKEKYNINIYIIFIWPHKIHSLTPFPPNPFR